MVRAVIFDYGGVISSPLFRGIGRFEAEMGYRPGSLLELLFGDTTYIGVEGRELAAATGEPIRDSGQAGGVAVADPPIRSRAVTHDWHRLEVGELSVDEWMANVAANAESVLGKPLDFEAYGRFQQEMPLGVHWMVVHRARELQASGYRLALLTNNVKEWGDAWRATFPVDELFPVVIDSSAVGMRKPDPRIYELTCTELGVAPDEAVFVDDNLANVEGARSIGMWAVHFGDDPWDALSQVDEILERNPS